jgi:hypothetical protein
LGLGFAFANPALDSQFAVDSIGFGEAIIDFGTEGVEGNAAPVVLFDAGEFGATQAASTADFDAFSAKVLGCLQGFFHGAPEGNTAFELERDVFGDQLGIDFGMFDFNDVNVDLFAGHAAEFFLELVDFGAFAADNDAGASSKNSNAAAICGALDQDLGHRSGLEFLFELLTNVAVFSQELAEFLFGGEPLGTPVAIDGDAEADWIGFLAHNLKNREPEIRNPK